MTPKKIELNKYGARAQDHWARTDPARYAAIPNPLEFFRDLGEQVSQEVDDLARTFAGPDPPGEDYLAKVGRLNMARLRAEEKVLSELVLIAGPEEAEEPATDLISEVMRAMHRDDQEFYDQNG